MKKILIFSILYVNTFASYHVLAKKDSVSFEVNKKNYTLNAEQFITLNAGDIVCFVRGDGRLILEGEGYKKQLSSKNPSCKLLPLEASRNLSTIDLAKNKILSYVKSSEEKSTEGAGIKGDIASQLNVLNSTTITIVKNQEYIEIHSSLWGPLPVILQIISSSSERKSRFENEDKTDSSFLIRTEELHNQDRIEVTNAFGDKLGEYKIEKSDF